MKVQVFRKSNKKIKINTSYFLLSYDEVRTNPEFFKQKDIEVGSIIDLPEENINAALRRNSDLYVVPLDKKQEINEEVQEERRKEKGKKIVEATDK